jgi:hypothetical protein
MKRIWMEYTSCSFTKSCHLDKRCCSSGSRRHVNSWVHNNFLEKYTVSIFNPELRRTVSFSPPRLESLTLLLIVREFSGSNLGTETCYPDRLSSVPPGNKVTVTYFQILANSSLIYPFNRRSTETAWLNVQLQINLLTAVRTSNISCFLCVTESNRNGIKLLFVFSWPFYIVLP